jgi:hypothetical protein
MNIFSFKLILLFIQQSIFDVTLWHRNNGFYRLILGIMKTAKTTAAGKPKSTSASTKATRSKSVSATRKGPSEDDIRAKAKEIYNERIAKGEHGTAEGDWHKAEAILAGKKK